jgi:hypothetical protein
VPRTPLQDETKAQYVVGHVRGRGERRCLSLGDRGMLELGTRAEAEKGVRRSCAMRGTIVSYVRNQSKSNPVPRNVDITPLPPI